MTKLQTLRASIQTLATTAGLIFRGEEQDEDGPIYSYETPNGNRVALYFGSNSLHIVVHNPVVPTIEVAEVEESDQDRISRILLRACNLPGPRPDE